MAVSGTVVLDAGGPGQFSFCYKRIWQVTATVDPASVATQANGTDTITVPGVNLGDHVISKGFAVTGSDAGMTITAYVSAANTVTVLYNNNSAGSIDIVSGLVKLVIGSPAF